MNQTIIHMADIYDKMEIPLGDWRRHLNLGWDSHVIKDMLGFCPHTKRLVGYAHDAFDVDVICTEFRRKCNNTEAEKQKEMENNDDQVETQDKVVDKSKSSELSLGKHYMVFMAQSVTSVGRPMCFMVARYCLTSLTGRWVRVNKRHITSALAFYAFIVTYNSFDGASENRSAMNQDLSISLRDCLPELLSPDPDKNDEEDLPCDADTASSPPLPAPPVLRAPSPPP